MKNTRVPCGKMVIRLISFSVLFFGCKEDNKISNHKFSVQLPEIPDNIFYLDEFGGKGDGTTLNTEAFKKAIDACDSRKGGKIIVKEGIWLTGPIEFKNNIDLHLENGAVILASTNPDDYPLIRTSFEGKKDFRAMALLFGKGLHNVSITGKGIIDGSGQVWRPVKKMKLTEREWKTLTAKGGVVDKENNIWWPDQYSFEASQDPEKAKSAGLSAKERDNYKLWFRPTLLHFINCDKVLLDGPTFQNSPGWNLHPLMCTNVTLRNITVRNPWNSQNGDGLDLESCKNVNLYNAVFDVGDDAICLKSGKNEEGRERGIPCENIEINNCIVYHGHGGFVVGSEMSGGVRNIHVNNCTFLGTDVGLRFKSTRGRGGIVENIFVENIKMVNIKGNAFIFNLFYSGLSPDEADYLSEEYVEDSIPPVTVETPRFKNIFFNNITCNGAERAIQIQGLPEMAVKNIHFENMTMKADKGINALYADSLFFKNVSLSGSEGTFNIVNTSNVFLDNYQCNSDSTGIRIMGKETKNIFIKAGDKKLKEMIYHGKNIQEDIVKEMEF